MRSWYLKRGGEEGEGSEGEYSNRLGDGCLTAKLYKGATKAAEDTNEPVTKTWSGVTGLHTMKTPQCHSMWTVWQFTADLIIVSII